MTDQAILSRARLHALRLLDKVDHYPYHNVEHTLGVYSRSAYLADMEGITGEAKTDLLIAAIFHDTGFTSVYPKNETVGAKLAEDFLREQEFPEERIARVRRIILATIVFSTPSDILEQIIQDADLDNLGRPDCFMNMDRVWRELQTISKIPFNESTWLSLAEKLLANFSYRTETARKEREDVRLRNLETFRRDYLKKGD